MQLDSSRSSGSDLDSGKSHVPQLLQPPELLKAVLTTNNLLVSSLVQAIRKNPQGGAVWHRLGQLMVEHGRFDLAHQCLVMAYQIEPHNPRIQRSFGLSHLRYTNIAEGLSLYDSGRIHLDDFRDVIRPFPHPKWDGQELGEKTILLWAEQGIGDQIMQARCLNEISAAAKNVIVECDPRLHSLLARSFQNIICEPQIVEPLPKLLAADFDWQSSLFSAWRWTNYGKVSHEQPCQPYLAPDASVVRGFREEWTQDHNLKVGLSWRSSSKAAGAARSIEPGSLGPLVSDKRATFHSLQYDCDQSELRQLSAIMGRSLELDSGDIRNDIDRLSAQIKALDLVITIPNVTADIAGSVGTLCWVMLPVNSDWRWGVDDDSTFMYAGMRLYRQRKPNDWDEVISQVIEDLQKLLSDGGANARSERV